MCVTLVCNLDCRFLLLTIYLFSLLYIIVIVVHRISYGGWADGHRRWMLNNIAQILWASAKMVMRKHIKHIKHTQPNCSSFEVWVSYPQLSFVGLIGSDCSKICKIPSSVHDTKSGVHIAEITSLVEFIVHSSGLKMRHDAHPGTPKWTAFFNSKAI